jgi:hypothetical protein
MGSALTQGANSGWRRAAGARGSDSLAASAAAAYGKLRKPPTATAENGTSAVIDRSVPVDRIRSSAARLLQGRYGFVTPTTVQSPGVAIAYLSKE